MIPAALPFTTDAIFRAAIDGAIDGVVIIDRNGIVLHYNRACTRIFGFTGDEVVGANISMLMPEPHRSAHDGYISRYLRTGSAKIIGIGRAVEGVRKDGTIVPIFLSIGEARVGDHAYFVGTIRDLTAINSARAEADAAAQRVRELENELVHVGRLTALGEMTSAIAHELNQPLTAIVGFLEAGRTLLEASASPPARVAVLMQKAVDQAGRAGDVIRHLRTLAKKQEADPQPVDINRIVAEACDLAKTGAAAKGIRIAYDFTDDLPMALADDVQVQQVVLNLVRNSIDALVDWPERSIVVATRRDEPGFIAVSVTDSGPGLAPAIRANLFKPFMTTKPEGLGIGLSICRTIVEAHGGRISAHAPNGAGVEFRFTVPVADHG